MKKLNTVPVTIGKPSIYNEVETTYGYRFEFATADDNTPYLLAFPGNEEEKNEYKENKNLIPLNVNFYTSDDEAIEELLQSQEIDEDANDESYNDGFKVAQIFDIESHELELLKGIDLACYSYIENGVTQEELKIISDFQHYIFKSAIEKLNNKRYQDKIVRNTKEEKYVQKGRMKVRTGIEQHQESANVKEESLFDKFKKTKIGKWIFGESKKTNVERFMDNVIQEAETYTTVEEVPTYPLIKNINFSVLINNAVRTAKVKLGIENRKILESTNAILIFKLVDKDNCFLNDVQFYRVNI